MSSKPYKYIFLRKAYEMQKKSAIRTKPILQSTKKMSNCCGGLRSSVYVPEKCMIRLIQKIEIGRTRGALKIGWEPGVRNFWHVSCRNVHVPPVRPHVAEKRTFQQTDRKRKQPKTHVPPQRFSVQQRCKNNAAPLKNSVRPLQQR